MTKKKSTPQSYVLELKVTAISGAEGPRWYSGPHVGGPVREATT